MTDLSPAARAVWEAFNSKFDWVEDGVPGPQFHSVAAALRAAADQMTAHHSKTFLYSIADYLKLNAIAAELEGGTAP